MRNKKVVLFVCIHNAGRSQMAEGIFNQLAGDRGQAYSAGTKPANKVNPVVIEAMQEIGIDISANTPKALTLDMVEKADNKMITMGCGDDAEAACPANIIETEDWTLDDPKEKSLEQIREIRDEIKVRVTRLINEIF
ncbi:arsenate reductase ArsC [Chloroflexota bacterium]